MILSDDDENLVTRKRPFNTIESDDEEGVKTSAPKRKLRFDDSDEDEEDGDDSRLVGTANSIGPFEEKTEDSATTMNPITGPFLLESDDLFTDDYEDSDMPVVNIYDADLDEDGGYKSKFKTQLDDEESNYDGDDVEVNKMYF